MQEYTSFTTKFSPRPDIAYPQPTPRIRRRAARDAGIAVVRRAPWALTVRRYADAIGVGDERAEAGVMIVIWQGWRR